MLFASFVGLGHVTVDRRRRGRRRRPSGTAAAATIAESRARHVSEPPNTPKEPRETEASKMSFLSVFSFGGSPTSQDAPTPTPVQPAADEVVEIKVEAPAPEPAVEVKKEEPKPAPAKACCAVC